MSLTGNKKEDHKILHIRWLRTDMHKAMEYAIFISCKPRNLCGYIILTNQTATYVCVFLN